MGAQKVLAPDGRVWRVGRRWIGERPDLRRKRDDRELRDLGDGGSWWGDFAAFDDINPAGILAALAIVVALAVIFTVAWPVLAVAIEILFVLLMAAVGLVGRLLFRRPWTVRARAGDARVDWEVRGWRASGELVEQVSARIAAGADPRAIEAP